MDQSTVYKESIRLLLQGSQKAIPFNIVLATLLALNLFYSSAPLLLITIWLFCIIMVSILRSIFCKRVINKGIDSKNFKPTLLKFTIFTLFMGIVWGACYLIFLPYIDNLQEFIIILVLGGMCAGAIASLSVYMPAYLAYILPMFLPVITYNYSLFNPDRAVLATMFLLFIFMLIISAKINKNLLHENFQLSYDKELLIDKLKDMTRTDVLTGLYNRRYFETSFPQLMNRAKRNKYFLTLISIDIDNFKLVNDTLGHPSGDRLLIGFALLLNKAFKRATDSVFRLGGDEFSVIIENQDLQETINVCEDINYQFKSDILNHGEYLQNKLTQEHSISLSMGVVHVSFDYQIESDNLIKKADQALYQAKNEGKNKIILTVLDDSGT